MLWKWSVHAMWKIRINLISIFIMSTYAHNNLLAESPPPYVKLDYRDPDTLIHELVDTSLSLIDNNNKPRKLDRNPADMIVHDMWTYDAILQRTREATENHPLCLKDIIEILTAFGPNRRDRSILIYAAYFDPCKKDSAEILPVLRKFLKSKYSADRAMAAIGIGKFKGCKSALEEAIKSENDPIVKLHLAFSLWNATKESKIARKCLVHSLESNSSEVIDLASLLLSEIGPQAKVAIPTLAKLLDHPSPTTRALAMHAIGKIGTDSHALLSVLKEKVKRPENQKKSV